MMVDEPVQDSPSTSTVEVQCPDQSQVTEDSDNSRLEKSSMIVDEHGNSHFNNGVSGLHPSMPSGPPPADDVPTPSPAGDSITGTHEGIQPIDDLEPFVISSNDGGNLTDNGGYQDNDEGYQSTLADETEEMQIDGQSQGVPALTCL